jgi:PilZ domain
MQPESIAMQPGSITDLDFDRRSKARFPIRLSVRYRTLSAGPALIGAGRTVNISSCGLLIASEEALVRTGARLQLTVDWPFLLHGITPLQLIVSCRVTRCRAEEFAVKLEQYQFKTKKR